MLQKSLPCGYTSMVWYVEVPGTDDGMGFHDGCFFAVVQETQQVVGCFDSAGIFLRLASLLKSRNANVKSLIQTIPAASAVYPPPARSLQSHPRLPLTATTMTPSPPLPPPPPTTGLFRIVYGALLVQRTLAFMSSGAVDASFVRGDRPVSYPEGAAPPPTSVMNFGHGFLLLGGDLGSPTADTVRTACWCLCAAGAAVSVGFRPNAMAFAASLMQVSQSVGPLYFLSR